jgi:spore coat protein U-like protein
MRKQLLFVALLGFEGAAHAGTSTSNLAVSATVTSTCSISAGSLAFGAYDPVAASQVDGSATVSVNCTKGATTKITLGQGSHAALGSTDVIPLRRMSDGTNFLSYVLFADASRTTVWGNTVLTGVAYNASSSSTQQLSVYGRITASQDIPAGSYTDVVVATITF